MPETEQCILGTENKVNINNLTKAFDEFKGYMVVRVDDMATCVNKITNDFHKKPPFWVVPVIGALGGVIGSLLTVVGFMIRIMLKG